MSERYNRQEESRLRLRLAHENVRRVLVVSIICSILCPILMFVYGIKPADSSAAATVKSILIAYEILSVVSVGIAYLSIKNKEKRMSVLIYRSYWLLFSLFSFCLIYIDMMQGNGFSFYSVMLGTLLLIPLMSASEQMYYIVIQAVFMMFTAVKFGTMVKMATDVVVLNAVFIVISRFAYRIQYERLQLKERLKDIKDSEYTDPLTSLMNRRGLERRVHSSIEECIRQKKRISVLLIDIDDLHKYNNEFGNERGDECIRKLSELIKQVVLRNTDILCRLDGGKFLVYMEGGNDMEPVALAEKVRTGIERKRMPQSKSAHIPYVSVSIGVASNMPRSSSDFTEAYDEACDSLYEAKERGKNIIVYDEQIYGRNIRRAN